MNFRATETYSRSSDAVPASELSKPLTDSEISAILSDFGQAIRGPWNLISFLRIMVASSGYLKSRGEPRKPQDLSVHDAIQSGTNSGLAEWRFVDGENEVRLSYTPRLITNTADAAIQYAEAGGGLTRVLAYQAADAIKRGRLKIVLAKFEQPPLPIHIVYPTSRLLSAKVRTFIDLVVEISDWHFDD